MHKYIYIYGYTRAMMTIQMATLFHSATPVVAADEKTVMNATDDAAEASGIEEELERAAEKVEGDFSKIEAKIHRYPAIFQGLMSKDNRYFVPLCVAIGPYHHRAAHLQRAEEMKRAAACFLCKDYGHQVEVVYAKILSVAGAARSCYDHDAVACLPQANLATMMFHDGCFLLQYINHRTATDARQSLRWWFTANQVSINRDIFLLENQVPWLVLDALMAFIPVPVGKFIANRARSFEARQDVGYWSPFVLNEEIRYKPAHLLDLLRYYQSGQWSVPEGESSRALTIPSGITSLPQSSSAVDLAEIGVRLTHNRTAKFRDMGVRKGIFFYKLFLAPLVMDDQNACWLLNMVAFEISCSARYGNSAVSSYVLIIAMLMNREEDVHELRAKHILHGKFSDERTLSFVKDLAELTIFTKEYKLLLVYLEAYKNKRWMWISLYKFIYNNLKSIITVFSVIGVLVGIFKTLFSIKQHQQ